VRYDSRYGSGAPTAASHACPVCTTPLDSARARYCSDACKQRAYRLRQVDTAPADTTALAAELKRRAELIAHTVYECPVCEARYLGEQRCADCNRFCRALGPGGACPHCDEPVLIADLLGLIPTP
jgi:hypothetical protein